jgi:hypothetical protein
LLQTYNNKSIRGLLAARARLQNIGREIRNGQFYGKIERTVEGSDTGFLPGKTKKNHELLKSENSAAK